MLLPFSFRVAERPPVWERAVHSGAGRIVWIIFLSSIISLSFSLSLGIGPILTEILSHWAIKSYNH